MCPKPFEKRSFPKPKQFLIVVFPDHSRLLLFISNLSSIDQVCGLEKYARKIVYHLPIISVRLMRMIQYLPWDHPLELLCKHFT